MSLHAPTLHAPSFLRAAARSARTACLTVLALSGLMIDASYADEIQYISDSTYIPLRTGQGTQYRIRMNLKTGDKLNEFEQELAESTL